MNQARPVCQEAINSLMTTMMADGTPVRDHLLKMIGFLSDAEILRAEIDEETQINIILGSFPKVFNLFWLNYNIRKM